MKKYFLMVVIALIAITSTLNAQTANSTKSDASKMQCCKMSKGSCKMDSTKCNMMGSKTDSKSMSSADCMAMCMNSGKAKCDTSMCQKNAAKCKQMKNCPMQK